ncbi:palmitoyltransferase ZDHHC18 isoform X1 [Oryzias latipes]|uniref:palmitoyltransferase ZDHHC18 isoform X1 n=1 Tax=Oryzias latipes TaxID=8090 RepID=UPI0009DAB24D|nr:palmitoyltransferase ZDHHC18 isoform X1 [Oryzias latipes]
MKSCDSQQTDLQAVPTPAPIPPPHAASRGPRGARRKWEVFPGKNRFYCGGRIMAAQQSGVLPLTLGLILVTTGLFFIFDCPFLVKHLSSCVPAVGAVLFVFVFITLLQTSFSDPGILPRATPEEAADVERQIDSSGDSSYGPPPRTREVVINQQVVKLKYCFTCKMFRPPRTSHCSLCDNCVERFDHHCPWVGNCVGKRNYRFFYTFIVSLSFLTSFIFSCVSTHLAMRAQDGRGLVSALQESPGSAVELVICFFSVWSILGLSGFHTYLVASNLTTNEDIKGSWSGKSGDVASNPFSHRNVFVNCGSVLCTPLPPSLIDRRGFLPEEEEPAQTCCTDVQLPASANNTQRKVCSQGRKGLLESAAPSPLQSTSCPQGEPQTVPPGPRRPSPADSEPTRQASNGCRAQHSAGSQGNASSARHSHHKSRMKKHKEAALSISNPTSHGPVAPTCPDSVPTSRGTSSTQA